MKSLLNNFHWMVWHNATNDEQVFKRFQPNWIKLVRPESDKMPFLDIALRNAKTVLIRSVEVSENWQKRGQIDTPEKAIATGNNIANAYKHIIGWAQHEYGLSGSDVERIVVEVAMNEPHVWTNGERSDMTALCTKTAIDNMTASGIRVAAGNFGVSWEGNHDTKDDPHPGAIPDWSAYYDMFKSIDLNNGWLSLHEYCDYLESKDNNGNIIYGYKRNWGWWGGHLYSLLPYFEYVGVKIPILVTEAGIDNFVNWELAGNPNIPRGWYSLVNSGNTLADAAARYIDILGWYDQQLLQFPDGLVEAIFPFTYDFQDGQWETFDMRPQELLDRLKAHIEWVENNYGNLEPVVIPAYDTNVPWYPATTQPLEPPLPPIEPPVTDIDIDAVRWNAEESVRDIEKSITLLDKARRRLIDNVIFPLQGEDGHAESKAPINKLDAVLQFIMRILGLAN